MAPQRYLPYAPILQLFGPIWVDITSLSRAAFQRLNAQSSNLYRSLMYTHTHTHLQRRHFRFISDLICANRRAASRQQ